MSKQGLSANALKMIALITMTVDHIGFLLFPSVLWLRIIGRLAFPIYAFMIAEGCRYTRSIDKYFGAVAVTALLCQVVSYVATGSVYQCILVTFSLSICLIRLIRFAAKQTPFLRFLLIFSGLFSVFFLTELLPLMLPGTDYGVDYGIYGVLLPLAFITEKNRHRSLLRGATVLALYSIGAGGIQFYCLLALPLLALYSGERGKWKLKWFFYLYYPAHLGVLYLLAPLI